MPWVPGQAWEAQALPDFEVHGLCEAVSSVL